MHDLLSCCGVLDDSGVVHLEGNNLYIKLRDNTVFPVHRRGRLLYLDYIGSADTAGGTNSTVAATTMVRPPNGLLSAGKIGVGKTSADDVAQSLPPAQPAPPTTPYSSSTMPAPADISNVNCHQWLGMISMQCSAGLMIRQLPSWCDRRSSAIWFSSVRRLVLARLNPRRIGVCRWITLLRYVHLVDYLV